MKATKKLIPAMAMLIVSAVVMSTASFAWFTMSREVTAKGMNVTVTAPNNLLIKSETIEGVTLPDTTTNSSVFQPATTANTATSIKSIYPASSTNGLALFSLKSGSTVDTAVGNVGKLSDYSELVDSSAARVTTSADGAYVDFKYTVKTEGTEDVNVVIKSFEVQQESASEDQIKALNCVRAAILDSAGTALFTDAEANRKNVISMNAPSALDARYWTAGKAITAIAKTTDTVNKITSVGTAASDVVFTVTPGTDVTFVLRVWLEGEDKDCIVKNAQDLNFNVVMVLADAASLS